MLTISQSKIPLILKRKFNNSIPTIVPQVQSGKGGKGRLYKGGKGRLYTDLDSLPDKVDTASERPSAQRKQKYNI